MKFIRIRVEYTKHWIKRNKAHLESQKSEQTVQFGSKETMISKK